MGLLLMTGLRPPYCINHPSLKHLQFVYASFKTDHLKLSTPTDWGLAGPNKLDWFILNAHLSTCFFQAP